jgi:ATP-dependent Clp protease ATP-binding subunit ClpC
MVGINSEEVQTVGGPTIQLSERIPHDDLSARGSLLSDDFGTTFKSDSRYRSFFDRLFRAIHRTAPRHVLLTRERGVGEQAVLLEAARRSLGGNPPFSSRLRFIAVDIRRFGSAEVQSALSEIWSVVSARETVVLCLDGVAKLFRSTHPVDHRSGLIAFLSTVRCRVVGIVSPTEFEDLVASDVDVRDLFTVINLHEPENEVAVDLVCQYAQGLELQFEVAIGRSVVEQAVQLTNNFLLDQRLPQKAVQVLRSICEDVAYDRTQTRSQRSDITGADVASKVAFLAGLPVQTLTGDWKEFDYESSLRDIVVGQDQAVKEVATELALIKAGFVDAGKPASVMLFIGQTGTGKTEMAKALARFYSATKRLKTFTLGNFSESHSVSGIIGVPAGYVGHETGGRLVNELNADPYGVFLLDEADKAHPDVMQPFLNLFDEGWLLDQKGVKAHGDRAIFILTTNIGQRQVSELCRAGKTTEEIKATMKESLSKIRHAKSNRPVFSPEFLARVKRIVVFRSLDRSAMFGIAKRVAGRLQEQWVTQRQRKLVIEEPVIERISDCAAEMDGRSQGKEGGRVVRKLFADWIESRIQSTIAASFTSYQSCGGVTVSWVSDPAGYKASGIFELCPSEINVRFVE